MKKDRCYVSELEIGPATRFSVNSDWPKKNIVHFESLSDSCHGRSNALPSRPGVPFQMQRDNREEGVSKICRISKTLPCPRGVMTAWPVATCSEAWFVE